MPRDRRFDAADIADVGAETEDHDSGRHALSLRGAKRRGNLHRAGDCRVASLLAMTAHPRSTPLTPTAPRRPAMTFDRCATSRTSTSTSASMKSGCRLTIFRLA